MTTTGNTLGDSATVWHPQRATTPTVRPAHPGHTLDTPRTPVQVGGDGTCVPTPRPSEETRRTLMTRSIFPLRRFSPQPAGNGTGVPALFARMGEGTLGPREGLQRSRNKAHI